LTRYNFHNLSIFVKCAIAGVHLVSPVDPIGEMGGDEKGSCDMDKRT